MADRSTITPELCRQLLHYEPETGRLFWKRRPREMFASKRGHSIWNARYADRRAFTALSLGYYVGRIHDMMFRANRVAWAITNGEWPAPGFDVDHINGDPADDRISNLRAVPHRENGKNIKRPTTNTSGQIGVSFNKRSSRWDAYIGDGKGRVMLGNFTEFAHAVAARKRAEMENGYHPNHGR